MSNPQQQPYTPPSPLPAQPKPKRWPWVVGVIGAFVLGLVFGLSGNSKSGSNTARETVTVRVPAPDGAAPAAPAAAEATPAQPAGPATTMGSGTYQVGVDVLAGQYKTAGPEKTSSLGCYWARRKDDSGSFEAIIANNNLNGPGSVTINDGEFLELNGDCTWTKVA